MVKASLLLDNHTDFSHVQLKLQQLIQESKLPQSAQDSALTESTRLIQMFERQRNGVIATGSAFTAEKTLKGDGYEIHLTACFGERAQPGLVQRIRSWLTGNG